MKKFLIIFTAFSLFIISCKEKEKEEPIDSITIKANIQGSVKLYDEFGERVSNELMLVYLEGGTGYYYGETEKDGYAHRAIQPIPDVPDKEADRVTGDPVVVGQDR